MATKRTTGPAAKTVTAIQHGDAKRRNIPTAEYQSVLEKQRLAPVRVSYPREAEHSREPGSGKALEAETLARNRDLDPQLVWRGKDQQDWSDLVVHAPPLYNSPAATPAPSSVAGALQPIQDSRRGTSPVPLHVR
jgi:adenine-specific DNA-methyltransferase